MDQRSQPQTQHMTVQLVCSELCASSSPAWRCGLHFEQLRAALVQADLASAADLLMNGGMRDTTCVSGALRNASGRFEVCFSPVSSGRIKSRIKSNRRGKRAIHKPVKL